MSRFLLLSRLDTIDVIHWTKIRPARFCKKQIFRSQVSTNALIRITGGILLKVYDTLPWNTSDYFENISGIYMAPRLRLTSHNRYVSYLDIENPA